MVVNIFMFFVEIWVGLMGLVIVVFGSGMVIFCCWNVFVIGVVGCCFDCCGELGIGCGYCFIVG